MHLIIIILPILSVSGDVFNTAFLVRLQDVTKSNDELKELITLQEKTIKNQSALLTKCENKILNSTLDKQFIKLNATMNGIISNFEEIPNSNNIIKDLNKTGDQINQLNATINGIISKLEEIQNSDSILNATINGVIFNLEEIQNSENIIKDFNNTLDEQGGQINVMNATIDGIISNLEGLTQKQKGI